MAPVREMTAETTTVPCTPAALAMAGYSGRMGASSIPAETPVDMCKGPLELRGVAMETLVGRMSEPVFRAVRIPSDIPCPMRVVGGRASGLASCVGWSDGKGERVAMGMAVLVLGEVVAGCACSTWTGGLGAGGTKTGRALMRDVSRSGCNKGRMTSVAAMAHCRVIEANAVQRLLEEM